MRRPLALLLLGLPSGVPMCTTQDGACICETDGGSTYDLTALDGAEIVTTGDITGCTACQGNWNYHFTICGNVVIPQAIGCVSSQQRSAYRIDDYPTPTSRWCEYMAEDATSAPPAVAETDNGLSLTYSFASGTITRSLTVNLLCDGSDDAAPTPGAVGGAAVTMDWSTAAACGGGAAGWLIVIIMSVAAGLYVGGGVAYTKRNDPDADLKAAHPHIEYWRQLPGLVSDGILFSRVSLSTNVKALEFLAPEVGGGGGYQSVDEEAGGRKEKGSLLKPDEDDDDAASGKVWAGIPDARESDEDEEGGDKKKKKKKKKKKPKPQK